MVEGWLLDTGARGRMCPFKYEISGIRPLKNDIYVSIFNGSKLSAEGIGTVPVILKTKRQFGLKNVLYVQDLDRRLLSIPALAETDLMSRLVKEYLNQRQ